MSVLEASMAECVCVCVLCTVLHFLNDHYVKAGSGADVYTLHLKKHVCRCLCKIHRRRGERERVSQG